MNESPTLYPDQSVCRLEADGWEEVASGNGAIWAPTSDDGEIGVVTIWDEAPHGATTAIVEFDDAEHEAPVHDGYYLFVAWDVVGWQTRQPPVAVRFI